MQFTPILFKWVLIAPTSVYRFVCINSKYSIQTILAHSAISINKKK